MKITKPGIDTKNPPSFVGATAICTRCSGQVTLDENDMLFFEFHENGMNHSFWSAQTDCPTKNCGGQVKATVVPSNSAETKTT